MMHFVCFILTIIACVDVDVDMLRRCVRVNIRRNKIDAIINVAVDVITRNGRERVRDMSREGEGGGL